MCMIAIGGFVDRNMPHAVRYGRPARRIIQALIMHTDALYVFSLRKQEGLRKASRLTFEVEGM